jgi:hypothetical protein
MNTVYRFHFTKRYRHAEHSLGSTTDLPTRLAEHDQGRRARWLAVVNAADIAWPLARWHCCTTEAATRRQCIRERRLLIMTELIPSLSIENLLNQRQAVLERIEEASRLLHEAYTICQAAHLRFPNLVYHPEYGKEIRLGDSEKITKGWMPPPGGISWQRQACARFWTRLPERNGTPRSMRTTSHHSPVPTSRRPLRSCMRVARSCFIAASFIFSSNSPGIITPILPCPAGDAA